MSPVSAENYYVRDYVAPPGVTGTTWGDAFGSIDRALEAAAVTEEDDIILVAPCAAGKAWKPGNPNQGCWGMWSGPGQPDENSTFLIPEDTGSVALVGGCEAFVDFVPSDCQPFANPTVLSGDIEGNDSATAWLMDDSSNNDNARRVITVQSGEFPFAIVDGFTITSGNLGEEPDGDPTPYQYGDGGSAVYVTGRRVEININPSGQPPFYVLAIPDVAELTIQNCTIERNAGWVGGAVMAERHLAFSDNGIMPVVRVRTSIIRENRSNGEGGGLRAVNVKLDIAGSLIVGNRASAFGGGLHINGRRFPNGETGAYERLDLVLTHCTIAHNVSLALDSGAGVSCDQINEDSEVRFRSTIIAQNFVGPNAGFDDLTSQILFRGLPFSESLFENSAFPRGYARCAEPEGPMGSAEKYYDVRDPFFVDSSLALPVAGRKYRLHRCSPLRDLGITSSLPIDETDVNHDGSETDLLPSFTGEEHDLRVMDSHPVALGGAERSDIGAIEHPAIGCYADLDEDGKVDGADLAILLGAWTPGCNITQLDSCGSNPEPGGPNPNAKCLCHIAENLGSNGQLLVPPCFCADFNRDQIVDGADLAVVLGAWGPCAPSLPEGAAASSGGEGEAQPMEEVESNVGTSPEELAGLFGFETIEGFSLWLAELQPSVREALLAPLLFAEPQQ